MSEANQRECGSGSSTDHVYAVEARAKHGVVVLEVGKPSPFDGVVNPFASTVLTPEKWTRVHVAQAPIGVPNRMSFQAEARERGFLTYQCAMAIACWFQAMYESAETRLVLIEFKSSYSTRELGIAPPMDLWEEDRQLYWHLTGANGGKVRSALPESATSVAAVDPHATK